jgi:hypothetical protein
MKTVINAMPWRLPEALKEEVNRQIEKLLHEGIMVPSESAFNSPLLLVPKEADASDDVKSRVVICFRKQHEWTAGDAYPLLNIIDIFDQLGKAKYFSSIELASGYLQIQLAERRPVKSAFRTPAGHFEFISYRRAWNLSQRSFNLL